MGSDGSHGPRAYTQRTARTVFLRVPAVDWPLVKRGIKIEFRAPGNGASGLNFVDPPLPVVAYTVKGGKHDSKLMVLEKVWSEELGSISMESLANEGFKSRADFRRYWMRRERRRFLPLLNVRCYKLRPFTPDDIPVFAEKLIKHLYGEWMT